MLTAKHEKGATPMKTVYAELGLRHAVLCDDPKCELQSCRYLKLLMGHVQRCSIRGSKDWEQEEKTDEGDQLSPGMTNSRCGRCIEYLELVKLHAKTCKKDDCPVENCKILRPSNMRQKLMKKIASPRSASSLSGSKTSLNDSRVESSILSDESPEITPKKLSSSASIESLKIDASPSPKKKLLASPMKPLRATSSFVSVNSDNSVPIISGNEIFSREHQTSTEMENPMYAEEEMGTMPQRGRWWCGMLNLSQ